MIHQVSQTLRPHKPQSHNCASGGATEEEKGDEGNVDGGRVMPVLEKQHDEDTEETAATS